MDGNVINAKKLAGKIVIINFWFINCAPCRNEIPLLNKLVSDYKNDSAVVFVAIALDSKKDIKTFLETTAFYYPVIYDGDYLARRYNVRVFPTNLIVDKKGKVAYHSFMSGPIPDYWMRKTIEEIKKGQN